MSPKKDYYKLLEVSKTANQEEIKKSYYTLAKKFHPDKNPNDPTAADKFKLIKEAYENLSDPNKRAIYDSGGSSSGGNLFHTNTQTRYKSSTYPTFFTRTDGGTTRGTNSTPATRIYTFSVFGGNVPVEEVLKMFFGGNNGFNQFANNPNRDAGPSSGNSQWKQQDNINKMKRDGQDKNRSWSNPHTTKTSEEYTYFSSGFVECPACKRKFNLEAASHHIPFCIKKTKEEGVPPNPLNKEQSTFKKSKEYSENIRMKHKEENKNNQHTNNKNMYSKYLNILLLRRIQLKTTFPI